jgi:hypothetical protein
MSVGLPEVVAVMLHEYDKLREELAQITTSYERFGLLVITALVALLAGIFNFNHPSLIVAVPPLLLLFGAEELRRQFAILYVARYLSALEERINRITDPEALSWERYATLSRLPRALVLRDQKGLTFNPDWVANLVSFFLIIAVYLLAVSFSVKAIWEATYHDCGAVRFGSTILYSVILLISAGLVLNARFCGMNRSVGILERRWLERWGLPDEHAVELNDAAIASQEAQP